MTTEQRDPSTQFTLGTYSDNNLGIVSIQNGHPTVHADLSAEINPQSTFEQSVSDILVSNAIQPTGDITPAQGAI